MKWFIVFILLLPLALAEPVALEEASPIELQLPIDFEFSFMLYGENHTLSPQNINSLLVSVDEQEVTLDPKADTYVDLDGNGVADFSIVLSGVEREQMRLVLSSDIGLVQMRSVQVETSDEEEIIEEEFVRPDIPEPESTFDFDVTLSVAIAGLIVLGISLYILTELKRHHLRDDHRETPSKAEMAVIEYIKREHNKGIPMSHIRKKLTQVGWSKQLLEEAFRKIK